MEFSDKRKSIENITNEVGEFHPLLESVLPKLPNVVAYEYTHGQHERGADFIIEVTNSTTGRNSYIGVVVKCGKVGSGKFSDVEEQIRECAEERPYQVLKRVRCSSVWVFASGGYTERTKEKLQERFLGRSIEFFGSEDVAKLVDEHFPFFWHAVPCELGNYLQQLSNRLHILDQASGLLMATGSEDFYIELDAYERIKKSYTKSSRLKHEITTVNLHNEIIRTKIGLLEADMGFGKSKLARRLALSLCNADSFNRRKVIPIFETYRRFVDQNDANLENLVRAALGTAESYLDDDKVEILVILDGLDEVSHLDHTSAEFFDDLIAQAKSLSRFRVLVTSRPLKSLVDRAALYGESRIFGIKPLSLSKIVRYLEETCSKLNLPARLFEDLKRSPLFRQLPQSPIAATLFSNLLAQSQQELPQSLTELYSKSTELMLGRWEQRKERATEIEFKTAQVIAELLAVFFVENRLIYVSKSEIDQHIDNYLNKRRIGITRDTIDSILFKRSNLFTIDDERGTVAFKHRSFAEYLCAHKMARDKSLVVSEAALDSYWTNVFFFYAGTLLDCPEILTELRTLEPKDETQEWLKVLSVPTYLLAAHHTEFEEVEANVIDVLLEAARLYLRVKSGNTATRLAELPEMRLLYLFKGLVVENLGYDFFEHGFESITLKIDAMSENEEVKAYAIFFLGCAALYCKNEAPIKFLVQNVGAKALPLSVSLAIRCELEANTNLDKDRLLKYHKDKLRRLLVGSGKISKTDSMAAQGRINDLFEKPLNPKRAGQLSLLMSD